MIDLLLELAGDLLFGAAVGAAVYLTLDYIDKKSVQQAASEYKIENCEEAIKAKILSKDTKKVNVGLFDKKGCQLDSFDIEANRSVSSDVYVGQEYRI